MVNCSCRYYNYQETGFYYLQTRHYDPAICRFINADTFATTDIDGLLSTNMFSYCENNPVMGVDCNGEFLDTIFDVISLGMSVAEVVANPADPWAWAGLVGDIVDLVPGVTGVGEITKGLGATTKAAKAARKASKAADNATDAAKLAKQASKAPGGACFIAGTEVLSEIGPVTIETIQVGDMVWATDPKTGISALKQVVQVFVNEATALVHVGVNGEEIVCTNEHPFYSPVKGWTAAWKLRAGDILQTVNDEYVMVEWVQHELLDSPIKVYNFEVEGLHTYYVGKVSILVHNTCSIAPISELTPTHGLTKSKKQMKTLIEDIRINGIQEPIHYVNYGGTKYVVNGHHRLAAAKALKMTDVPVKEVTLPYAGYHSIHDLFW